MKLDIEQLKYRKMDINDLDLFVKLRLDFLYERNNEMTERNKILITESLINYYKEYFVKNEFIGIICEYNGKAISTAYLAINVKPANFMFPNGRIGTLLNVYTYPEYRKNGISTEIMKLIIDEAKKENISEIELLATDEGKNIYRKYGFNESDMTYMSMII